MILPLIDVPVSIIGTFAAMAALGFSLNNISLFGLVLAIGIVVDDAIVVLENIERMMAKGYDPRTAAIKAMDEVTGPIIAVGLVLCACSCRARSSAASRASSSASSPSPSPYRPSSRPSTPSP